MTMNGKELLKRLLNDGWVLVRIQGSHHIVQKGSQTEVIPVHGNTDLPKGLLSAIIKRTGLKVI